MTERIRFTEYLDLDVDTESWYCNCCGHKISSVHENYKTGLLVADRDPTDIHAPVIEGEYSFSPDGTWVRLLEFYCPGCFKQIETEYLPPGHPVTHDIELDFASLKARLASGDLQIVNGRLWRERELSR